MTNEKTATIRDLNDRFRRGDVGVPGRRLMTIGVQALLADDPVKTARLTQVIAGFSAFDADNDPWGEHDFGALDFEGARLFWKIDAYAPDMEHGSEDASDPEKTVRVLTIMLAEEY
jgi:hypothetical protein